VKERPILFSAPMVRAVLAGTKTQTRRIVRGSIRGQVVDPDNPEPVLTNCPYGAPGDRLWVREAHAIGSSHAPDDYPHVHYLADGARHHHDGGSICREADTPATTPFAGPWRPSIHMPRWASRLDLEVTEVRVEQLARMPGHEIRREGVPCPVHDFPSGFCISQPDAPCLDHYRAFAKLWDGINPHAPWASNPWVWVVSFKLVEPATRAA
jgi:hypothetical protein